MKKLLLLTLLLTGCAASKNYTPEDQACIAANSRYQTSFQVPKSNVTEVWGRAHSFLATYCSTKPMQHSNEYVIETNSGAYAEANYHIVRMDAGDKSNITITAKVNGLGLSDRGVINGHALSRYMQTGDLPCPNVVTTGHETTRI